MDVRISEMLCTIYYKRNPLPNLTVNNEDLLKQWLAPYPETVNRGIILTNTDLKQQKTGISYPEDDG